MARPRALVMSGYGLNCEEESAFALNLGGADATIVHVNDLIDRRDSLDRYQILVFPGGFSYGDDTGSGNAFANRVRNHLWDDLLAFAERDTLTAGICNGFQILANLGLLVTAGRPYGERIVALLPNSAARYTARWVDLEISGDRSPIFRGIERLSLPVAHGEGRLFAPSETLARFREDGQIAARYFAGEICEYQQLPADPNGSLDRIAALTDASGRIMGMMPHPERAIFATQLPNWRDRTVSAGFDAAREEGPGLRIFQNIAGYFS